MIGLAFGRIPSARVVGAQSDCSASAERNDPMRPHPAGLKPGPAALVGNARPEPSFFNRNDVPDK
jgi:hypothetical protein